MLANAVNPGASFVIVVFFFSFLLFSSLSHTNDAYIRSGGTNITMKSRRILKMVLSVYIDSFHLFSLSLTTEM